MQASQPSRSRRTDPAVNPIVVIPASMNSTRLPGKPLADIAGRPMVLRVLDVARAADIGPVVVACAETEIAAVVEGAGGTAVLTHPHLPSGSDRVHAALEQFDPDQSFDTVINLQGELPTLPPEYLRILLPGLAGSGFDIATLAAPIRSTEEAAAPSVVKVATGLGPDQPFAPALYFSRAAIPWGDGPLFHHIGLYAYRREALARFVGLPTGKLEARESLEQLRALEAGLRYVCALVPIAPFGVDTPEDLARARCAFGEPA